MAIEAPLNIDCFPNDQGRFDPRYAVDDKKARDYFEEASGRKYANAGIFNPRRGHLPVGGHFFRFCDSRSKSLDGGWWVNEETFLRVRAFARRHGHIADFSRTVAVSPLAYAAKLHLAVPFEWGDCDHVVEARLVRRLDAYAGYGNVAFLADDDRRRDPRDGGAKYIPVQQKLAQLFIPDMKLHFRAAMKVMREGPGSMFG